MASFLSLVLLVVLTVLLTDEAAEASPYYSNNNFPGLPSGIANLLRKFEVQQRQQMGQMQERIQAPHVAYIKDWPKNALDVGQIAGVAVNLLSQPVIFHRGKNAFDNFSFNSTHHYQHINEGPIQVPAILVLDPSDGHVIDEYGKNKFYLPHGIDIDNDGNIWVTDVALHQVMKFKPGSEEPSLVLGEAFVPGSDQKHFCKPTDVAVASNGEFFVSDGYCNSRIQKYNSAGEILSEWGHSKDKKRNAFAIPHSLALVEEQDLVCVADRENNRIQCFSAGLTPETVPGKFVFQVPISQIGRVYAIAYGRGNSLLHGIAKGQQAHGFTIDLDSGEIIHIWSREHGFDTPHDIAVSPDGANIYVGEIQPNRLTKFRFE